MLCRRHSGSHNVGTDMQCIQCLFSVFVNPDQEQCFTGDTHEVTMKILACNVPSVYCQCLWIRIRNNALQEKFRKPNCRYWHIMYPVFILRVCRSGSVRAVLIWNYFSGSGIRFFYWPSVGTGSEIIWMIGSDPEWTYVNVGSCTWHWWYMSRTRCPPVATFRLALRSSCRNFRSAPLSQNTFTWQ